jgi:hypothetical protein
VCYQAGTANAVTQIGEPLENVDAVSMWSGKCMSVPSSNSDEFGSRMPNRPAHAMTIAVPLIFIPLEADYRWLAPPLDSRVADISARFQLNAKADISMSEHAAAKPAAP